jgi:hypothetical protein
MGDVQVVLQEVTEIPRSANGKVRSMICAVPAAEREAVLRGQRDPLPLPASHSAPSPQ